MLLWFAIIVDDENQYYIVIHLLVCLLKSINII